MHAATMKPGLLRCIYLVCLTLLTVLPVMSRAQVMNACDGGEEYVNHNQNGPIVLSRLSGVARDPYGTPMPKATILLFTEQSHKLLSKRETDGEGRFSLPKPKNGRYRLVAKACGFCSANVPIRLQSGHDRKTIFLHMKMGEVDSCSYGDIEK